jgi:hemerythrin
MTSQADCSTGNVLATIEAELVALLESIAGEQGVTDSAEVFAEKMARLVRLLPKYFDIEEPLLSSAQAFSGENATSHFQAHNQMLEHCVQWQLDLMQGKVPPRSEICTMAQGWLGGHFRRGKLRP